MPVRSNTDQSSSQLKNAEAETSRTPSPRVEEMPSTTLENPLQQEEPVPEEVRVVSTDVHNESSDDEPDDGHPRKVVRRAQSLDSTDRRLSKEKSMYLRSNTLSTEQEKAVEAANKLLTAEQREQIAQRQDKVATRHENEKSGSSRSKGKTDRKSVV